MTTLTHMTEMTQKRNILVCILPDLKMEILKQYIVNSASFANQIGANIHFLIPTDAQTVLNTAIKDIPIHEFQIIKTVSHPIVGNWSSDVVNEAVSLYSCDLILIPLGSITEDNGWRAKIRKDLLEHSSAPILVFSPEIHLEKTPIQSVLIPMSGEIRVSSALKFGLRLAGQIHAPVDLVHVLQGENQLEPSSVSSLNTLGDQPHHEYRDLLERVLAEACPFSDTKERAHVRKLYHFQGTPSVEILKAAQNTPSCALVAEWHGSLIHGKAETLKNLLHQITLPIFLVKTESEQKSILKIGPENQAA